MKDVMKEKICNCSSKDLLALITEYRSELTKEHVKHILEKVISAYAIFVVRCLDKHALLAKEHKEIVIGKCPVGHRAEMEFIFERAY